MKKWRHALKEADDWLADMNFGTARRRVGKLVLKMRCADNREISMLFSREDKGAMLDLKLAAVSREISCLVRGRRDRAAWQAGPHLPRLAARQPLLGPMAPMDVSVSPPQKMSWGPQTTWPCRCSCRRWPT